MRTPSTHHRAFGRYAEREKQLRSEIDKLDVIISERDDAIKTFAERHAAQEATIKKFRLHVESLQKDLKDAKDKATKTQPTGGGSSQQSLLQMRASQMQQKLVEGRKLKADQQLDKNKAVLASLELEWSQATLSRRTLALVGATPRARLSRARACACLRTEYAYWQ